MTDLISYLVWLAVLVFTNIFWYLQCKKLVGLESCVYEDDFCSYGERKDGDEK